MRLPGRNRTCDPLLPVMFGHVKFTTVEMKIYEDYECRAFISNIVAVSTLSIKRQLFLCFVLLFDVLEKDSRHLKCQLLIQEAQTKQLLCHTPTQGSQHSQFSLEGSLPG